MTENKPKQKLRYGQVTVTVWNNTKKVNDTDVEFESFQVEKSYTDKEGNWQTTNNYQVNDLYKLRAIVDKLLADRVKEQE
jgi:hypothetical protein